MDMKLILKEGKLTPAGNSEVLSYFRSLDQHKLPQFCRDVLRALLQRRDFRDALADALANNQGVCVCLIAMLEQASALKPDSTRV